MPEREYVAPKVSQQELDLRERWNDLWHDNKDRAPRDMLLELFCAVMFPHKEEAQAEAKDETKVNAPVRR